MYLVNQCGDLLDFPWSAVGIKFVAFVAIVGKLIKLVELIELGKSVCGFT